jgi:acyl-CoA reductase-like NAD-dependent aldehyde dehydrogenase
MAKHPLPRPRDPLQLGKLIVDIATGQVVDEVDDGKDAAAAAMGRKGAAARAKTMTPERRAEIARKAASARWKNS